MRADPNRTPASEWLGGCVILIVGGVFILVAIVIMINNLFF